MHETWHFAATITGSRRRARRCGWVIFIIGWDRSRWNLSKTWTTRKPLIFQENKHSEETKAWYLDETLRAIASNSWSRMVFSRTVFFVKVRYAFSWTGMLLTRIPDLKTNPFATEFDRFYFEIYANRVEVSFSVGEIDVTKKKTRFSHARISDHKNFE